MVDKTFLGRGWAFPVTLDGEGQVQMVAYEADIEQAVKIILGTSRGERVMRPDFGAGLNDFLFEPINTATIALVKQRVTESLITWEPRIDSIRVAVTPVPEQGLLQIEVSYRIRLTNTFYNVVYPFYLIEGDRP